MAILSSDSGGRSGLRIVGAVFGVLILIGAVYLTSDWGYWHRWITRPADMMEPPDEFYSPVAVVKGSPSSFFDPEPAGQSVSEEALEAAASWAENHKSTALLVWHDGRVAFERYWLGLGPDQLFTGRSISKTLAPLMIGAAIQDGHIENVDEPVSKYVTEWADDPRGAITIRQLLNGTAGLERPPMIHRPVFNKAMRLVLGTDLAKASLAFDLVDEPGTRFAVNNVNSQLLGMVVESATGQEFEQYLSEKLWAPLGAGDSELYMDRRNGMPATYCCFRSTPRDWLRLGAVLANGGRVGDREVVSADWLREMRTGSSVNPLYGYSLWLGSPADKVRRYSDDSKFGTPQVESFVADDTYYMEGGGNRTIWVVPSKKLAILRLGYSSPGWDTSVIPNTILRGMTASQESAGESTADAGQ